MRKLVPLFIILILVLITVGIYFFYFIRAIFTKDAPYIGTFGSQIRLMKKKLSLEKDKIIFDLGCGDGKALRFFAAHFHPKSCIGYDINLFAILGGKIWNVLTRQKTIFLYHKNFSAAPLQKADYIYIYLFRAQVASIENRVFTTKRPDTVVICNTFEFKNHTPYETITDGKEKIFLYT